MARATTWSSRRRPRPARTELAADCPPSLERRPAPAGRGRRQREPDSKAQRMKERELLDNDELDDDPDHLTYADGKGQERGDSQTKQPHQRDQERSGAEETAEDEPGYKEILERAACQQARRELHDAAVGRRNEADSAGQCHDPEQNEQDDRGSTGTIELRPRNDGGRLGRSANRGCAQARAFLAER